MDEFFRNKHKEYGVKTINGHTMSKNSGKQIVLLSGEPELYFIETQIQQLEGIDVVHPKSALGKFLEKDETVLRTTDFLGKGGEVFKSVDYSMVSNYKPLEKEVEDDKENVLKKEEPLERKSVFVGEGYEEESQVLPANVVPMYKQQTSFNPATSWYSSMPRGLESRMYYAPRFARADSPKYYASTRRDVFNPYEGQRKPENLFEYFSKKSA